MPLRFLFPPSLGSLRASVRAELLERSLATQVGEKTECRVADSYAALREDFLAGRADLAWAPPLLCAHMLSSAQALFRAVRLGYTSYLAAIVGRNDGPKLLAEAAQRALSKNAPLRPAWVDPLSIGGHFLPMELLRRSGLARRGVLGPPSFVGSYRGALQKVAGGEADLAAVPVVRPDENVCRDALQEHLGAESRKLIPLAYTDATPNDAVLVSARVNPLVRKKLEERLLENGKGFMAPTFLLEALGAERLVPSAPDEYRALLRFDDKR